MAPVSMAAVLADAWDCACSLAAYGSAPLTVGWHRGEAFVRLWDFRRGHETWRRLPSRDGQQPANPPRYDPFSVSDTFYRVFRGGGE